MARKTSLSDVAIWVAWFLITASILLAGCMILTLVWPS